MRACGCQTTTCVILAHETNHLDNRLAEAIEIQRPLRRSKRSRRDDSVSEREMPASESAIHPGACATASVVRKLSAAAAANKIENSGSSPDGNSCRSSLPLFPIRCAGALFIEDLKVAPDALDAGMDEEVDLERRGQDEERQQCDRRLKAAPHGARQRGRSSQSGPPGRHKSVMCRAPG